MFNPNEHLMNLKGKDYLQVMWRLVWFREEKPLWNIDTKLEQLTDNHAVFSAKISDENGVQKASGYGSESMKDFRDFIEKAETKAIGRALAMLGYGTQFAPELDEGERIVDSPVEKPKPKQEQPKPMFTPPDTKFRCEDCGAELQRYIGSNGKEVGLRQHAEGSKNRFGRVLCLDCIKKIQAAENA